MRVLGLIIAALVALFIFRQWTRWTDRRKLSQRRKRAESLLETDPDLALETIFITVPCYDVRAAAHTIVNLFNQAVCPGRIWVGTCHLLDKDNPESINYNLATELESLVTEAGCTGWSLVQEHVRIQTLTLSDSNGESWLRAYMEQLLYRNEKYYMPLDNHTEMVADWDSLAVEQLNLCSSDYPVLTWCTSLTGSADKPSFLSAKDWENWSLIVQPRVMETPGKKPLASLFYSPTHSFCLAERLREVPSPQEYYYSTWAEELTNMSIRLWTSGWDFYCPTVPLCYARAVTLQSQGNNEMLAILPGSFRTVQQYQQFCGVDFASKVITGRAQLGVSSDSAAEVTAKYGSMTVFQYNKALVTS